MADFSRPASWRARRMANTWCCIVSRWGATGPSLSPMPTMTGERSATTPSSAFGLAHGVLPADRGGAARLLEVQAHAPDPAVVVELEHDDLGDVGERPVDLQPFDQLGEGQA